MSIVNGRFWTSCLVTLYLRDVGTGRGEGYPKRRWSKAGCASYIMFISTKCRQGVRGSKSVKVLQTSHKCRPRFVANAGFARMKVTGYNDSRIKKSSIYTTWQHWAKLKHNQDTDEIHNSSLSFAFSRPVEQRCHDAHSAHQPTASKIR